ncbi:MAG: GNAT family N-acetyltransferase, partial [Prevotella intermedia]
FWNILNNNLTAKYDARPVHSLAELQLLMGRFPKEIKLYMATTTNGEPLGGTLIYETPNVVHTQYISASPDGKAMGALDLLFDYIINKVYKGRNGYFDFGKSTEAGGTVLNQQLIHQKEGFGGRGVCYDTYEWKI